MSAPITNKVWSLRLIGNAGGKPMNNVFFYQNFGGGGTAAQLLVAFYQDVLPFVLAITSLDAEYTDIQTNGVQIATDFAASAFSDNGTASAGIEPRMVALGYRYNRLDNTDRNGYKRFGGLPDDIWISGQIDTAYTTDVANLRAACESVITEGGQNFAPCMQRRQKNNVVLTTPEFYNFLSVSTQGITTQNSRK